MFTGIHVYISEHVTKYNIFITPCCIVHVYLMFTGIHVYISELATNYNHYFMLSIMFTGIHVYVGEL